MTVALLERVNELNRGCNLSPHQLIDYLNSLVKQAIQALLSQSELTVISNTRPRLFAQENAQTILASLLKPTRRSPIYYDLQLETVIDQLLKSLQSKDLIIEHTPRPKRLDVIATAPNQQKVENTYHSISPAKEISDFKFTRRDIARFVANTIVEKSSCEEKKIYIALKKMIDRACEFLSSQGTISSENRKNVFYYMYTDVLKITQQVIKTVNKSRKIRARLNKVGIHLKDLTKFDDFPVIDNPVVIE